MEKKTIYECRLGDSFPLVVVEALQKRAFGEDEDFFLRFNGVTISVTKDDTEESLEKKYKEGLHIIGLYSAEKKGKLIRKGEVDWNEYRRELAKAVVSSVLSTKEAVKRYEDKAVFHGTSLEEEVSDAVLKIVNGIALRLKNSQQ